jgi:hypothetical protein
MAGDVVTPLLIIHLRTIGSTLWEEGWRNGENFVMSQNDSSYGTQDISNDYLSGGFH